MDLFLAGLKEIAGASSQLTTWALAMLGGSVAIVIGSSHYSPADRIWRSFYFLLVPAWISLLVSVWSGNELSRSYLAALLTKGATQDEAFNQINADFQLQLDCLLYGIIAFAFWLAVYLIWWVLFRDVGPRECDT